MSSNFWKVFTFIICDVVSVVSVPFLSCLLGGWIAATMNFGQTVEVMAVILSIVLFTVALLWAMNIMFDISYYSELATRSNILKCLFAVNFLWLVVTVRQLVKVASKKDGVTLGATPFGFFLASLIFSCSKFVVYIVLFTIKSLNKIDSRLHQGNVAPELDTNTRTSAKPAARPSSPSPYFVPHNIPAEESLELRERIFNKLRRRSETLRQQPILDNASAQQSNSMQELPFLQQH